MNLTEEIQKILRRMCGYVEYTPAFDTDTLTNIQDAEYRAAFFGDAAIFWIKMVLESNSPNIQIAVEDAKLAYQYAKIAYNLRNERFAYLATNESVSPAPQSDTPRETGWSDRGVSE
jgi:hypothetical protein